MRILTIEEYKDIINFLKGDYSPSNSLKFHLLKRKCRTLHLKKGMDAVEIMAGKRLIVGEFDTARKLRIIRACHDDTGHPGRDATFERIYQRYTGILKKEVSEYIKNCPMCRNIPQSP
jgi:transposase-like protein